MDQPTSPPPAARQQRGCLRGCLIGLGILFAIGVLVLVVMFIYWRQVTGAIFQQTIAGQIDSTSFPAEEKEEAKVELSRFTDAFKDEQYDRADIERGLMVITESPVVKLIFVNSLQRQYLRQSELAEEEMEEGRLTIQRFAYGILTRAIDQPTAERTMEPLSTRGSQGEFQLKTRVSDEELRTFLAEAKKVADGAQIPEDLPAVDLSAEMKRVVDAALIEAGRDTPDAEAPVP